VAHSADAKRYATAAALLPLVGALAGCVETTQQQNARARLQAERVLASQNAVQVTRQDPGVTVRSVAMLRGPDTAIAIVLRNDGAHTVTDLPISVGVRIGGRTIYLNRSAGLPYPLTHVASLAPGALTTWVFTSTSTAPAGGRPFARVGSNTFSPQEHVGTLPSVTARVLANEPSPHGGSRLKATITNHSEVPQYGLAAYAYALAGGRLLAAGNAVVPRLDAGSSATVAITLTGTPGKAPVNLDAPPTIFE
jgi:hypothetical protein